MTLMNSHTHWPNQYSLSKITIIWAAASTLFNFLTIVASELRCAILELSVTAIIDYQYIYP